MAGLLSVLVVVFSLVLSVHSDCYMHNPRGNNDRLMEENTNRNNGNRLFRSENNAQGGYCWGPTMYYYAGSKLSIEWTSQHGCGNPNLACNVVIQYMCGDDNGPAESRVRDGDGSTTNTINANNYMEQSDKGEFVYGMNEDFNYFSNCTTRNRNKGLFAADQNINGNSARFTRQENNGNQYGFECGEEAIYYPYWHPSPWKDIVVFTNQKDQCKMYKANSQNTASKNFCSGTVAQYAFNNEGECKSNGGTWNTQPSWGIDAPDCQPAPYNRDNHLGNGVGGAANSYNWTLPTDKVESCIKSDSCACILRIRYNVSTSEIPWNIDSTSNGANSPVTGDPDVTVAGSNLTLAIDTNQYGRTFQDRSFVFRISPRPSGVSDSTPIYNLNVRGKRGNIVQAYPAVEYDFTPNVLAVTSGDYIHFQWTGCDHNAGGQAGEGRDKTDRSNIVQISSLAANMPMTDTEISGKGVSKLFESDSDRIGFAHLNQEGCTETDDDQDEQNCRVLNAASSYYDGGLIKMNTTGSFFYMSTRNNNFSNRSQKGSIVVKPVLPAYAIALIVVGGTLGVGAAAAAGTVAYAKKNPSSGAADFVAKVPGLNKI